MWTILDIVCDVLIAAPLYAAGYVVGGLSAFIVYLAEYAYAVAEQGYSDMDKVFRGNGKRRR